MNDETHKQQVAIWIAYSQQLSTAIRYTEALAAVEKALALDATNVEACYVKGTCLCMLGQYQQALQLFERALALDPRYAPAWDGKAWALGILGQREAALEAVNQALRLDPESMEAQRRKRRLEML